MMRQASASSSVSASSARHSASLSAVSSPLHRAASADSAGPGVPASPGQGDIEMNQRLKEIFDLIGNPERSRDGIEQLYAYQKLHPQAGPRIQVWMSKTGNYFQTYLKRALDNLRVQEEERNAGAAPPGGLGLAAGAADESERIRSRTASAAGSGAGSGTSTPTRPVSMVSAIPGSPRSSLGHRASAGLGSPGLGHSQSGRDSVALTGDAASKLQALQGVFGYSKGD